MTSPPITRHLEGDWAIRQGSTYGFAMRIMSEGELIDTSGMTAQMKIRKTDWDGEVQIDATTANGKLVVGYSPGKVARSTAYIVGSQVIPVTGPNGFIYECTVAGTSHATDPPAWPTVIGQTVTDGTVTWRCESTDDTLYNLYLLLDAAYTATLVDWGKGVWDLELIDGSYVMRLYQGVARLSREATY